MNIKKCISVLLLGLFLSPAVWAMKSSSQSIRVSCTILPALEIASFPRVFSAAADTGTSAPRNELALVSLDKAVGVNTNLGNQYNFDQQTVRTGAGVCRLYSVTAL